MKEKMKHWPLRAVIVSALMAGPALAAEQSQVTGGTPEKSGRMGPTSGTPVNSAIGGGGIVPKGMAITALNFSYRDKHDIVDDAGFGARTSQQELYLLKLRYGLTDRFELLLVPGYVSTHRDAYLNQQADRVQGPTDFAFGGTYAPLLQPLGEPFSLGLHLAVNMPTGQNGRQYPPGGGAWSYSAKAGISKVWQATHRFDGDIGFVQPMETGNQGVRKGRVTFMTGSYHYVFNPIFDAGLEFTLENGESWQRDGVDMRNGQTEMYVGPTINFSLPKWKTWLGIGVFVPVLRDYDIPTASDKTRFEIKLGKLWSW